MKRLFLGLILTFVCLMANATPTVKILFVYTPLALAYYGSPAQVNAQATREIIAFNSALSNSGISAYGAVASVGITATPTEYPITPMGAFSAADDLGIAWSRDVSGADVVVVLGAQVATTAVYFCGWVWDVFPGPKLAFAVVASNCVDQKGSVRHEVGHILGLRHQATGGLDPDATSTPYPLGHGFQSTQTHNGYIGSTPVVAYSCFYDLMARELSACPNIPGFTPDPINGYSNPSVLIAATSGWVGFPSGDASFPYYANAASVLVSTLPLVATYHVTKTSPGIVVRRLVNLWSSILLD